MKRLVCATLALSLLGATAASAAPFGHGGYGRGGYSGHHGFGHRGPDGALIGLGVGLFALGAIAASQHNYYDRNYAPPPAYPGGYYDGGYGR